MKKLLCTCLMLCLLCGTALADGIWEPRGNVFYKLQSVFCQELNRSYYTNSPAGGVAVYGSPGGSPVEVLENGVSLWVYRTYKDLGGTTWGIVEYNKERETGWLNMEEMLLIYDEQSFREEHADQLRETEQLLDLNGLLYRFYPYPGSPENYGVQRPFDNLAEVTIRLLYTDPEGREWGRCDSYFGSRNIWFCLSDLENPDLPVTEHTYDLHPTGDLAQLEQAAAQTANRNLWFLGGGVALVCGATAFLIFRMKKPK